ncbi:VirB3 family type IV secretion system protein [Ensifer sp. ENS07]|uniref:conjugal transfer protein TrbD n=1 Tax=Ensifer TaxID=106591 RepID=UPI000960E674|nr:MULTISPECIES: conjugal transfer protein TrbD [Ensifer]OWZ90551.1 conjugal transfer protein TrbD [Sinorhizobium sp. LM21]MBD9560613.1 VirB3 family type IV secretion system protein [Ensifer sp. ENS03]MBD9641719.1 VirB3 family type IV secretion system protein [Ensifer sp. ENS07]OKP67105.1 conjugal transfer protein TrbD [Ensifer adhaerens]UTV40769.1 conjugal transfer protein TrbD [Ensifer adhaerens]
MEVGRRRVAETGLQRNRIHRALSRPNLLLGADRELVLITGLAAVILIFVVLTVYSALFGIAVWIMVVGALRIMAKSDPLMRKVYLRHISYRPSYRPTASPWRKY